MASGESKLYFVLASFYNRTQQYKESEKILRRAASNCSNNGIVHYHLALVSESLGKRGEALTQMEKAIQLGLPENQKRQAEGLRRRWKAK